VETYWTRWRRFLTAIRPRREELWQMADRLARAEAQLLDAEALTPERREARIVELAERAIARHWRHRPCPALRRARLPKIAGRGYFSTPADALHWLDLDPELVAEALRSPRSDRPGRHRARTGPVRPGEDADFFRLVADVRDRLFVDRIGIVAGPLFPRLLMRLLELAEAKRRGAAAALRGLLAALQPDLRGHRPPRGRHALAARSRERRDRLDRLAEEQEEFCQYCAELEPADLPPPLREAPAQKLKVCAGPPSAGGYAGGNVKAP